MLIPEKLTITNYCQIKNLEIDFSAHQVFAITASNGRGKTNTLNALRFALSGQASPGASKLSDDIRDQADEAEVILTFSLTGGSGIIRRSITRKGTECSLKLSINGEEEEYTKTTAAEKRFTSLLGVSPKHISEVIIAEQHSIDALLFWPASERGPKFQRFLHGEIFSEIEKLVGKEKKKVLLDPLAQDRLAELEKTLKAEEEKVAAIEKGLSQVLQYLESPAIQTLEGKVQQIVTFGEYQKQARLLEQEILQIDKEIENTNQRLTQFDLLPKDKFSDLEQKVEVTSARWNSYRPFQQAQSVLQSLKPQEEKLSRSIREIESANSQRHQATQEISQLEAVCTVLRTNNTLRALRLKLAESHRQSGELKEKLEVQEKKLKSLQQEQEKLPIATLHLLQEVFQYMDKHQSSECIVCAAQISNQRIKKLKSQQEQYAVHHAKLSKESSQINKCLKDLQQEQIVCQSQIETLQREISNHETELENTPPPASNVNLPDAEQSLLEAKSRLLGQDKQQAGLPALRTEHLQVVSRIQQLENIPLSPVPSIGESDLTILQQQLQRERKKIENSQSANLQISKSRGRVEQLQHQLHSLVKTMEQAGLPAYTGVLKLTPDESMEIGQVSKARVEKSAFSEEKSSCLGALKTINSQLAQARQAVARHEETKHYISDLEQLEQWFRYSGIPSKIMQRQLNNLCGKMEEIISQFTLTRHFRLTVNEDLEVFMLYADGTIRPIHKASGGERMILGIAFRLATHQYLSPELPFLALDEPSNHLVDTNQVVLQEIIRDLKNSLGKYGIRKLVYCTHSRALANEAEIIINLDTTLKN